MLEFRCLNISLEWHMVPVIPDFGPSRAEKEYQQFVRRQIYGKYNPPKPKGEKDRLVTYSQNFLKKAEETLSKFLDKSLTSEAWGQLWMQEKRCRTITGSADPEQYKFSANDKTSQDYISLAKNVITKINLVGNALVKAKKEGCNYKIDNSYEIIPGQITFNGLLRLRTNLEKDIAALLSPVKTKHNEVDPKKIEEREKAYKEINEISKKRGNTYKATYSESFLKYLDEFFRFDLRKNPNMHYVFGKEKKDREHVFTINGETYDIYISYAKPVLNKLNDPTIMKYIRVGWPEYVGNFTKIRDTIAKDLANIEKQYKK